jgi:hypothetical protein
MCWIILLEALIAGTLKNPKEGPFQCRKNLNKTILPCPSPEVETVGYRVWPKKKGMAIGLLYEPKVLRAEVIPKIMSDCRCVRSYMRLNSADIWIKQP